MARLSQKYLARRGSQWQFYRRVLTDVVEEIGRQFWRTSLSTDSRGLAEQRVIAHVRRTDLLIHEARTGTLADETIQETAYIWRWSTQFSGPHNDFASRETIADSLWEHAELKELKIRSLGGWDRLICAFGKWRRAASSGPSQ